MCSNFGGIRCSSPLNQLRSSSMPTANFSLKTLPGYICGLQLELHRYLVTHFCLLFLSMTATFAAITPLFPQLRRFSIFVWLDAALLANSLRLISVGALAKIFVLVNACTDIFTIFHSF